MGLLGRNKKLEDPVCGMEVDKTTVYKAEYMGKGHYFCSAVCKEAFVKEPYKYVKR